MLPSHSSFPDILSHLKEDDSMDGLRCRTLGELIKSGEDAQRVLRTEVAKAGLTIEGLQVLNHVADGQNSTPGQIADQLGMSRVVMSHVLARLEISGLITRRRDPANRRLVRVSLTSSGRTTLDRATKACEQGMLQIAATLNESSLLELHRACVNVNHQVEGMS